MKRPTRLLALLAVLSFQPLMGQKDFEISAVSQVLDRFIEAKEISGAVTYVGDREGPLDLSVRGFSDLAEEKPMSRRTVFWIASMTKPVTATAVMLLHEEGLLSVEDPVSKFLPEFASLKDAEGNLVSVTIEQCLSHTSGLSEVTQEESRGVANLATLMPLVAGKPVKFAPGSKWEYCQSSLSVAARVVEVISGKTFPDFLRERLFDPLKMKDTTFYLNEEQLGRLAISYKREADGRLTTAPLYHLDGKKPIDRDHYPRASGGLFSTAMDYANFARMILRGGELDGHRFLKEETVKMMTTVRTGDLTTGFTPGNGWGIGWCVVREPQGVTAMLSPGSFGHGGAYGTQAWIDPTKGRFYLLFVQRANFPNSDASDLRLAFQEVAADKL